MADLYQHIAETIRDLRRREGLSQEALAGEIGEPPNTVSRWETMTYKPSAEQLESLSRRFRVSITVFFPGMKPEAEIPQALLSAMRGMKPDDLEEVTRYAEFRRARAVLREQSARRRNRKPK
jgi:transcriptional regulator with XRE-family HTH domain